MLGASHGMCISWVWVLNLVYASSNVAIGELFCAAILRVTHGLLYLSFHRFFLSNLIAISEELPPDASLVLKKVENSVLAAKKELKAAAKLKAEASIEEKKAQGLEGRVAELEEYQGKKEKFAEAAEDLARKADEEYAAEEDQVKEMNGDERAAGDSGQITAIIRADQNGEVALRRRLQRHLPLLRVVDKLAQRVGAVKGRGLHPRSRHQLPSKSRVR